MKTPLLLALLTCLTAPLAVGCVADTGEDIVG